MVELSNQPWGAINESDDKDVNQFCAACLIDLNPPGKDTTKVLCTLLVKEPVGAVNRNALAAAAVLAGARGEVSTPPAEWQKAAGNLLRLYREADMEPPESLRRLAGT